VKFADPFSLNWRLRAGRTRGSMSIARSFSAARVLRHHGTPKFNVFRSEQTGTAVTLSAEAYYDEGTRSSPVILMLTVLDHATRILNDALNGKEITEDDLRDLAKVKIKDSLTTFRDSGVNPTISVAQTVSRAVGLQFARVYMAFPRRWK